ncbi:MULTISPECIES: galactonate dehydratase [unclassified Streptomyces]|uniref:Galactonate dehydratase n=1 Tax=Streptomyces sp. NBC_00119 TaxID=2975659 RepID=A0AAU1UF84_9ACTN|nr:MULTISPECIES: galactonate dehydratase [unclassified Streptomyces]MCX4645682.1 galactonate dehydratase [Streptomyces sp. NBC_01446]MCX5318308.1 galactonate dehydratase [Streptomyces sp. NBC_00120]
MKIARIETFLAPPRWMFVRVETDEGVVGWGEPVVEGRAEPVRAAVEVLAEHLVGQDPLRIEDHWQVMTKGGFYRGGPVLSSAVAGLDQALWDIKGKTYGQPVHQLLGGPVRERIRTYAWVGGDEPSEVRDAVSAQVEAGFTAVKMNASGRMTPLATREEVRACLLRAETAREVLGDERDFALDFHGRVSPANARRLLPLLAEYAPLFVEEPVLSEHMHAVPDLVNASNIPIALGERLFTRREFLAPLQAGVAVVQPDISHAGGISELRRIAALAEMYGAHIAPHCPLGPVALAASLQVAFTTPNFLIQEQSIGIHYNKDAELLDYVADREPFRFVGGSLLRTERPGLGVDVDEAAVRAADAKGHAWRNPVWRYEDGSFAEW